MAVRKVRNHGSNITGSFPSLKMNHPIPYESTIERDFLYFLEFDTAVVAYVAQPFVVSKTLVDGKTSRYTPDFEVTRTNTKEIIECKPASRVNDEACQRQLRLGQAWAEVNNYGFVIVTDRDLRSGHRLANLKLLWRSRSMPIPYNIKSRCISYLQQHQQGVTVRDLLSYLADDEHVQPHADFIYSLLFHHVLTADLSQHLSANSRISLTSTV